MLKGITPKVDSQQGKHIGKNITDGQYDTFWASKKKKDAYIEFQLGKPKSITRLMLQEYIPLGQRVKAFSIYYRQGKNWVRLDPKEETTTIGYKRILRFDKITTSGIPLHRNRRCKGMPLYKLCFSILITRKKYEKIFN